MRAQTGRNALPGSPGDYSWSGDSGTYFWIDPREQLIAILMMQAPLIVRDNLELTWIKPNLFAAAGLVIRPRPAGRSAQQK